MEMPVQIRFNKLFHMFQGICDGAGSIILASEEAVKAHNIKPLAKIIGYHISGKLPLPTSIG